MLEVEISWCKSRFRKITRNFVHSPDLALSTTTTTTTTTTTVFVPNLMVTNFSDSGLQSYQFNTSKLGRDYLSNEKVP